MSVQNDETLSLPQRKKRIFIAENFEPNTWNAVEPYYKDLLERKISSSGNLKNWLRDWSELDAVLEEASRWIYVRTTIDTADEKAKADLTNLYTNIVPHLSVQGNLLNKKFVESPFVADLDQDIFFTTIRRIKKSLEIFREENVPLQSELNIKQTMFDQMAGAQSIQYNGKELTMQQAMVHLKSTDRKQREEVFRLITERKAQDAAKLDELFSELIQLRHKIALNAGYKNFMEYRFDELGRFDYTPADCLRFHESIHEILMPLVNEISEERAKKLGLDSLRPWDTEVDTSGKAALKPFSSADELVEKTIACFNQLDPYFAERIEIMREMKYLDLESRMHKGSGGFNMPLPEIGVPFIFMNSANGEHDLVTMVHEGGHAVHTFLVHPLELTAFKETTSEIAEVASMAMELMSMEHWNIFYPNGEELQRAKKNHLQYILSLLTKTCLGDSFQFWVYENPNHTVEERRNKWTELQQRFTPKNMDWTGYEDFFRTRYQSIMHFYQVPFYYIEYAFAQLGALAIWKNFKQNPQKTVEDYKRALSLGYTKSIPEFYETAGAKFDFSKPYISSLVSFLKEEIQELSV
jgi:oligoendopeptidase F